MLVKEQKGQIIRPKGTEQKGGDYKCPYCLVKTKKKHHQIKEHRHFAIMAIERGYPF